jgi:hypothetical protein
VTNDASLAGGGWVVVDPVGTVVSGQLAAPEDDATSNFGLKCFVTGNGVVGGAASASDVDLGPTTLMSKAIDLTGQDGLISFAAWFFCDDVGVAGADFLNVDISNNDGQTWTPVYQIATTNSLWKAHFIRVSDYVAPTAQVKVRFWTVDSPNNSTTEAGIDNFQVEAILCEGACPADLDSNQVVDGADLGNLLSQWGAVTGKSTADFNSDGVVDGADLGALLSQWGPC